MPPSTTGQWTGSIHFVVNDQPLRDDAGHTITDDRGLFVLHAVLLHTGKVLIFGGHVELAFYPPLSYVFDPKDPGRTLDPIPFPAGMDLFCCHYVHLPNGNIIVVGGSERTFVEHGSTGAKNICFFKPSTTPPFGEWRNTGNDLIQGRWYPTPVMMPDRRVMVVSGRPEHGAGTISDKVEMLRPPFRATSELTGATKAFPIYPGLHLAPNGKVYWTHTTWGQEIPNPPTSSINVPDGAAGAAWTEYAGKAPTQPRREEGMSVLLPLTGASTDGRILVIGGSRAEKADGNSVFVIPPPPPLLSPPQLFDHVHSTSDARSADVLDTTMDPPVWTATPTPMVFPHTNGHCVLLPDETVLICGGHNGYKWQPMPGTVPTMEAELFTPGSGFTRLSATPPETDDRMRVAIDQTTGGRMYHSVALLLPDGRVFVAGGANPNEDEPRLTYPAGWNKPKYGVPGDPDPRFQGDIPLNQKTFEFYEPTYYFKPDRASMPEIDDVLRSANTSRHIRYGASFKIKTHQAASIDRVAIMRPGAPTHHTDTEQRYVRLAFTKATNELNVTMESDKKRAPPGWYMLWIVDSAGRPCKDAVFINLVP